MGFSWTEVGKFGKKTSVFVVEIGETKSEDEFELTKINFLKSQNLCYELYTLITWSWFWILVCTNFCLLCLEWVENGWKIQSLCSFLAFTRKTKIDTDQNPKPRWSN